MSISDNKIQLSALTPEVKKVVSAVNGASAAVLDITAANLDLQEKATLLAVRAGTATRANINASHCNPALKQHCLDIAAV